MALDKLSQLLECPRSRGTLKVKNNELYSEQEDFAYYNLNGIPWLFKEADVQLYQWQNQVKSLVMFFQTQANLIDRELSRENLLEKTEQRLNKLKEAIIFNAEQLLDLLQPLIQAGEVCQPEGHQLALEKLPDTQHLNSYFHTLFRDWAWSTQEVKDFSKQVIDLFNQQKPNNLVVLGSGASRLSLEVHKALNIDHSVCVDINPVLLLSAKQILDGKSLELFEVPMAPLELKNCAVKQSLKYNEDSPQNFDFLFADALNMPFKVKSLEAVLTPWFIDIVAQDLSQIAKKINHCLKKEGVWVNYGPLSYNSMRARAYSKEEIVEVLESAGFKIEEINSFNMDYLVSPHSSQGRHEKVLGFRAIKINDAKEPAYFKYLPDWITDIETPIPKTQLMSEVQFRNQVAYQLLNLVDGQRSQKDIIPLMMNSYKMTEEIAKETLVTFLTNYFENKI